MKNSFRYLKLTTFIVALSVFSSCGGGDGNTGSKVTEIDSTRDSTAILHQDQIDSNEELEINEGSGVEVSIGEGTNFNWEDFRNQLQATEQAIGEGFHMGEDEVATSWEKHNEKYSFQTVYKYRDNQLWLQTYYKENNGTSETDSLSNGKGQLLTQDVSEEPGLEGMWEKMEEKAKTLASGNTESPN